MGFWFHFEIFSRNGTTMHWYKTIFIFNSSKKYSQQVNETFHLCMFIYKKIVADL